VSTVESTKFFLTDLPCNHFTSVYLPYSHYFSPLQFSVGRIVEWAADSNFHNPYKFVVAHLNFIPVSVIPCLTSNILKKFSSVILLKM
jgi:hypothetical protein